MALIIDRIVWQARHGRGGYTARVYAHFSPIQSPESMRMWFNVTRDYSRGNARKWRAALLSLGRQRGVPKTPTIYGYGRTREAAIHDALKNATKV